MRTPCQHRESELRGPFHDRVHFREAALAVAGVGAQGADRDPGVEFGLLGADHACVLDGAFGGGEVVGARLVEHAPARGPDQDLGVHLGRGSPRTRSCALAISSQPSPRPRPATSRDRSVQNQAARSGSRSSSSRRSAVFVIFRARSRSPP